MEEIRKHKEMYSLAKNLTSKATDAPNILNIKDSNIERQLIELKAKHLDLRKTLKTIDKEEEEDPQASLEQQQR